MSSVAEKQRGGASGALGFPRMGPNREMKFALEKYWRGALDEAAMLSVARGVEDQAWDVQIEAGMGKIAVGDHVLYDMVLSWYVVGMSNFFIAAACMTCMLCFT